jgi:predicted ribosome quality control (RQC) complex YloA/Tae2 family protein
MKGLKEKVQQTKIQKVKQVKDAYSFELYKDKTKYYLVIIPDKGLFLTDENYPGKPKDDFCNILRKYLTNQVIEEISQYEFDRVVEIETEDYKLVAEIFGNGNLILISKSDNKIIRAIEMRSWASRDIKPNNEYQYPPTSINPFKLNLEDIKFYLGQKETVKVLASDFGFGGEFAEKICNKLGIDKDSRNKQDAQNIYHFLRRLEKEFPEMLDINEKIEEQFKKHIKELELFSGDIEEKVRKIRESQKKKLGEFIEKEEAYRQYAESIYEKYGVLNDKMVRMKELQNQNISKEEIEKRLDIQFDTEETIVQIGGIPIDYKKSLEENANDYFEFAKKMKSKIEGLEEAKEEIEKKEFKEKKKKKITKKNQKHWYDQFRWFKSSDGFLIVSGKDAQTNEKLIRKYMKENDLVFHTDITGSPFTLVKNSEKKEIPETTIQEAAEFCGAYSKAWKIGISLVDVYYISPDQVKKEGGLPTGSFMIYGKRDWVRQIPTRIAVGNREDEIIYGPPSLVKRTCKSWLEISPGEKSVNEIFEEIKNRVDVSLFKLQRIVPYGKGEVVKSNQGP